MKGHEMPYKTLIKPLKAIQDHEKAIQDHANSQKATLP